MRKYIFIIIFLLYRAHLHAVIVGDQAEANGVGITTSGEYIIAGTGTTESGEEIFVARYESRGVLDINFAGNGVVITSSGTRAAANDLVVDGSDQPIVVGHSDTDWLIARYTTSGVLDIGFGTLGITTTAIPTASGGDAKSVAIDGDGEFIVGGSAIISLTPNSTLARYDTAGILSAGFGTGGIVTTIPSGFQSSSINAVATIGAGVGREYYAGGFARNTTTGITEFLVIKLTSTGAFDGTFGTSGIVTTAIGTVARIHAIIVDSSGNIVVVGESDGHVAIARYTSAGVLDVTFNSGGSQPGVATLNIGKVSSALSIAIQSVTSDPQDEKIVIGGFSDSRYFLARYHGINSVIPPGVIAGTLDNEANDPNTLDPNNPPIYSNLVFGQNARIIVQVNELCSVQDIAIDSSNNIIVAGGASGSTFLAIHDDEGNFDTSFANEGIVLDVQGEDAVDGTGGAGGVAITQTGQLDTLNCNIKTITFNEGRRLIAGDRGPKINQVLRAFGHKVTISTLNAGTNDLMIFDSNTITGEDVDLGSPNATCPVPGPGVGAGGAVGAAGENCPSIPLDNILITSEDNNSNIAAQDDDFFNPTMKIFDFDNPVKIISMRLLDIEADNAVIETFADVDETTKLAEIPVLNLGDNGLQEIIINSSNVKRMKLLVPAGSGASIVDVKYQECSSFDVKEHYAFAFDTITQTVQAPNAFVPITFDTTGVISGWTHTAGSSDFLCQHSGQYLVSYEASMQADSNNVTGSIIIANNGTEVPGSQSWETLQKNDGARTLSNAIIVSLVVGDTITFQLTGDDTTVEIVPGGDGGTTTSIKASITRIA